jgi:trehalose 6-phosphate synthase
MSASQNPDDPGVLILSRFVGAAQECKAALLVNPYDPDSVAVAITGALDATGRTARAARRAVPDIQHWVDRFLTALEREPMALSRLEQMPSVGS